jgi:uncharacterized protein YjbI with pentapeptide repeats
MDPTVVAAWIAAGVRGLTLIGTLAAQYLSYRATSRDAEKTAEEQRKQLDRTLGQQRDQLDRTLAEQNQQLDRTLAEQRTRTLNERFATAAEQLGSDRPAVRLAGVYAMAGLADDWDENRQTCIEVLCAYLQLPYEPDPGQDAPERQRLAFQASQKVRHTVIRVITAHLKGGAAASWQGLDFDFTGVVFDGGSFAEARFSGGEVSFAAAKFSAGEVSFGLARFSGGIVDFNYAEFSGGTVDFDTAVFSGGWVHFNHAEFTGSAVHFGFAKFTGSAVHFESAKFTGGQVGFDYAEFTGGGVGFDFAQFSSGTVSFQAARFSSGTVSFHKAGFSGGEVDFSQVSDWSVPPAFSWTDTPPPGVKVNIQASLLAV